MSKYKSVDRATRKAMSVCINQIFIYINKGSSDDRAFQVALYRFVRRQDLPKSWEELALFKTISDWYQSNRYLHVTKVKASEAEIEEACERLELAMLWVTYRWLPIFKRLLLKKLGSQEALVDYMFWCFSLGNKQSGSLEVGKVVKIMAGYTK